MKRISLTSLSAGLGLALLAAPMAMAQQWQGHPDDHAMGHDDHAMSHEQQHMAMAHEWHHGDRFNGHREVVSNWDHYHVRRPPAGYEWVHDGNQLVMIAIGTGLVVSTFAHGY